MTLGCSAPLDDNPFRYGSQTRCSLVEIYWLARVGIDQADRLRRAGGGSVPRHLVRLDLRLNWTGPLPVVQNESARSEGYAHGRPDAYVLIDGNLPAAHGLPPRDR
jgi:hypothetical protein